MSFVIETDKELKGNKYIFKISVKEVTAVDQALLTGFGEPEIDTGGTIVGPSDTKVFPTSVKRLPSGFPLTITVDGKDFVDPSGLANAYIAELLARIATAIADLRLNSDGFTGEFTTTI
jgi:hypothetical protein